MKGLYLIILISIFWISCGTQQTADIIFINGEIHTVNESNDIEEAVAVKDGTIIIAGSSEDIMKLAGENTQIIDLKINGLYTKT